MSDSTFAKCSCQNCGIHLEFPTEAAGTVINCPHCGAATELVGLLAEPEPATPDPRAPLTPQEILAGFTGPITKAPISVLYQGGLLFVTVAMVLLPILYVAMIGAAAWGVYYWATHFTFLLKSMSGGVRIYFFRVLLYGGPLFIGLIVVLFMVKPLFARRAPRAQPLALNPGAEPVLFMFITKICETIRAPFPKRIDLDCQLNASAGFRRGAWSLFGNDLVLTIGMPLVAGLNLREFAGVVAHEFGHFTQGFGMRLSYVIRSINAWFARVVFERDAWDLTLDEWAEAEEGWLAIVVGFARLAVWLSRQLLTLLMLLGHGIGCFMLRQMEYDADSCEIKLAGSETFEASTRRIHVLNQALGQSYKNMHTSWNLNRRVPDNFPAYLLHHDASLLDAQRTKLEDSMGLAPTGMFDTHPSNGDRIRRARLANEPGVFHLDSPATGLFSNFEVPAKQVTRLHYADDLGLPVAMALFAPVKNDGGSTEDASADSAPSEPSPPARPRLRVRLTPPAEADRSGK